MNTASISTTDAIRSGAAGSPSDVAGATRMTHRRSPRGLRKRAKHGDRPPDWSRHSHLPETMSRRTVGSL